MSCILSDAGSLGADDELEETLHKLILRKSSLFSVLSNRTYRYLPCAQLIAVLISPTVLELWSLSHETAKRRLQFEHSVLNLCWLESRWICGELCLVTLHEEGVTLTWLPDTLQPTPRDNALYLVWKDVPGVLSVAGSREEYFADLVCYEGEKLVLAIRAQETQTNGGSILVFNIGRQQDLTYCMSVSVSEADQLYCASISHDYLYLFISFQLSIHSIERSKILYKLDTSELSYRSEASLVLGNSRLVAVIDNGNTLHLISWNQAKKRQEEKDPWLRELDLIENLNSGYCTQQRPGPMQTFELHAHITHISFYPGPVEPDYLMMTSHIDDVETSYFLFELERGVVVSTVRFSEAVCLLGPSPFPVAVSSDHMFVVLPDLNTDDILDKLLVYRSAEVASAMSHLNNKPTDRFSHSSLAHALTYQQIESVNFCLNKVLTGHFSLEEIQETCEELVARCSDDNNFSKQVAIHGANFIAQAVGIDHSDTALPKYMSQLRAVLFKGEERKRGSVQEEGEETEEEDIGPRHWGTMDNRDIIKEVVLNGKIALAEYYLEKEGRLKNLDNGKKGSYFVDTANNILVELLKKKELVQARQVMANMMLDGNSTLKEICVSTDDMALCTYLVSELPHNLFTKEEMEGERFLRQMHQYGGPTAVVLPLKDCVTSISIQLNWVIGWDKAKQDLLLYEQQCLHKLDRSNSKQFSKDIELDYQIWRDGLYVEECEFELLNECYMSDRYFFTPLINQYTIQNRMILEGKVNCSLNEYLEAYLASSADLGVIRHHVFEEQLLEKSLEQQLYSFTISHLLQDRLTNHSIDSPEFLLIKSYIQLAQQKNQESMFDCLLKTMMRIVNKESDMSTSHPLSVMALLLYSSNRVHENLNDPSVEWCSAEQLKVSLAAYPKIQSVLYPEASKQSPPPDTREVLEAFDDWKTFGMECPASLTLTDPELSAKHGRETTADYRFYLKMGRPFYAFMSIMDMKDLVKEDIVKEIYEMALDTPAFDSLVGSSVIVTELLCRDCTNIVVDVQVIRLLLHNKYYSCPESSETVKNWLSNNNVEEVIPLLTDALRSRGGLPRFEGQLLLRLFCKRGSMDIVCQHDNWLDLVWNLHAWQVEKLQAVEIMKQCVPALRAHMKQIFYRMEEKTHGALVRPKYQDCCGIFGKIAACIVQEDIAEKLLVLSKEMPVAAVLAYTFKVVPLEKSMTHWIQATLGLETENISLAELLPSLAGTRLPTLMKAFQIFHSTSKLLPFILLVDSLRKGEIPNKLSKEYIQSLENWSDELVPNVGTAKEFIVSMLSHLITSATTNFEQFVSVRYLSDYPLHRYLTLPDYFRLSLLREVLQESRLTLRLHHEDFETILFTKTEIHRTISTSIHEEEAVNVLEKMLTNGQYDLARKFAQIAGFNTADAIFKQIKNQLTRFKKSNLWKNLQNRLNFWNIIANRFELFQTELAEQGPIIRAKFYLLEGCNQQLGEIERSHLISQGLSAILTAKPPSIGPAQADRLSKFYWATVANAYLNKEPPVTSFFNPLETVQDWELADIPKRASSFAFPDYAFDIDDEVERKIEDFTLLFLQAGALLRAERISTLFGIVCQDMLIVKTCQDIAEEYVTIQTLPKAVKSVVTERYTVISPTTLIITSDNGAQHRIEEWSYSKRVRASASVRMDADDDSDTEGRWQDVSSRQDVSTRRKRTSGSRDWAAIEEIYIGDLLETYVKSGSGLCEMFSTFYKMSKEQGLVYRNSLAAKKHLEHLIRYRSSASVMKQFLAFRNINSGEITVIIIKILKKWMVSPTFLKDLPYVEFKKLADLVQNHLLLATQIWDQLLPKATSENLLRLLLFTHHCYSRAHCSDGRLRVLEFCKAKSTKLAQAGHCQQLVDLFFEAEQFNDMLYICDLVYNHTKFGLFVQHPHASKKPHFQSALLGYLQQQHPDDELNKESLCLAFNKHIEIAKLYHNKALTMAADKGASVQRLEECAKKFAKAARHYKLDQAYEKQVECTKQARLVSLQINFKKRNITVGLLALSSDHVRSFLNKHSNFYESYIVAAAYNIQDLVPYVFRMSIVEDNMDYFEDFRTLHCTDTTFFEDFLLHGQRARRLDETATRNLIVILSHCSNIRQRRLIAQKLSLPTTYLNC